MKEADDRGGPGILTDCLAGLADITIWADRGPIDQNPSKIEPQDKKGARRANAAPPYRKNPLFKNSKESLHGEYPIPLELMHGRGRW